MNDVTDKVLSWLTPSQRIEIASWAAKYPVFDLRLHSLKTCPFLAYLPAKMFMAKDSREWALWLYEFYREKDRRYKRSRFLG